MKRLALTAAAAVAFIAYREWKKSEGTRQVWEQATDAVDN